MDLFFSWTVVPILSVLLLAMLRFIELGRDRKTWPGHIRARWTLHAFLLVGWLMLIGGVAELLLNGGRFDWGLIAAGWSAGIASFALRRATIKTLGKWWSLHVETRERHELILSGPFRWLRHPTYLSMVLELMSFMLILNAWYTGMIALGLLAPLLIIRIRIEEAELVKKFGEAYKNYQARVPALIPYRSPTRQ